MSLASCSSRLLGITPKVWVEGDRLCARTNAFIQLLTLFSSARRLCVDRRRGVVELTTRWLWAFGSHREIPFARLAYVDSEYSSMGTSWGWTASGYDRTDEVERYVVSLVLKEPEETVRLFAFSGEGAVATGWGGVLMGGDSTVDFSGNQGAACRQFVLLLREFCAVPIGKPVMHLADERGTKFVCAACGRPAPPTKTSCLYCGGEPIADRGPQ